VPSCTVAAVTLALVVSVSCRLLRRVRRLALSENRSRGWAIRSLPNARPSDPFQLFLKQRSAFRPSISRLGVMPSTRRNGPNLDLKPCVTCGLERVSRRQKGNRYPYNGLYRPSRNFGTSLCRARQVSVRHWGRCRVPKLSCSKPEFVRASSMRCRRTYYLRITRERCKGSSTS